MHQHVLGGDDFERQLPSQADIHAACELKGRLILDGVRYAAAGCTTKRLEGGSDPGLSFTQLKAQSRQVDVLILARMRVPAPVAFVGNSEARAFRELPNRGSVPSVEVRETVAFVVVGVVPAQARSIGFD